MLLSFFKFKTIKEFSFYPDEEEILFTVKKEESKEDKYSVNNRGLSCLYMKYNSFYSEIYP